MKNPSAVTGRTKLLKEFISGKLWHLFQEGDGNFGTVVGGALQQEGQDLQG